MQLSDLTSKKPEELNRILAELLGRKCGRCQGTGRYLRYGPHEWFRRGAGQKQQPVECDHYTVDYFRSSDALYPRYTDSWDAIMPEVRKLTEDQFINYLVHLTDVADGEQVGQFRAHYDSRLVTIALILTLHP